MASFAMPVRSASPRPEFWCSRAALRAFVDKFTTAAKAIKVGDGLDPTTKMGPLVRSRRVDAMESFVGDAKAKGATVRPVEIGSATRGISSSRRC